MQCNAKHCKAKQCKELQSNATHRRHDNMLCLAFAMLCLALSALRLLCFGSQDTVTCDSFPVSLSLQSIAHQSKAEEQNAMKCKASHAMKSTEMQCKCQQSSAMQCKAFILSVSTNERKLPNWGRAGFIFITTNIILLMIIVVIIITITSHAS